MHKLKQDFYFSADTLTDWWENKTEVVRDETSFQPCKDFKAGVIQVRL